MLALLRTPRWIGFTCLVIVAIIGFGLLSRWQWARAEEHRIERISIEQGYVVPGKSNNVNGLDEFSRVSMIGNFVPESTQLIRQRPLDGGNGYWVMSAFQPQDAPPSSLVWILRGWLGASTQANTAPEIPEILPGNIQLEGLIRLFEVAKDSGEGLPINVISAMSTSDLERSTQIPGSTFQDRVVQITTSDPTEALTLIPVPSVDEGQNISYAVQWILFALVAIIGWFIFLRREAADEAQQNDQANISF